jgi:hypothetical protein
VAQFPFIEDPALRSFAEKLWDETYAAYNHKMWHSTGALSGAVLELVLVAVFEQLGDEVPNAGSFALGKALNELNVRHQVNMPEHVLSLADPVAQYRYLFYPGRARDVGPMGAEEAQAAFSMVKVALKWLTAWGSQRFAYRATEVVDNLLMNLAKGQGFGAHIANYKSRMSKQQWDTLPTILRIKYKEWNNPARGNVQPILDELDRAIQSLEGG